MQSVWLASSFLPDYHWNRVLVCGFPGAGNVVTSAVLTDLRNQFLAPSAPPVNDRETMGVLHGFASHHNEVSQWLSAAVPRAWNAESYVQHSIRDKADFFIVLPAQRFVTLCGVSLGSYLNADVYSSHQLPTWENIDFHRQKGYRPVLVVRHPLDIILSVAAKCSRIADARILLADERWLRGTARLLSNYYRPAIPFLDEFCVVNYEQCITEPTAYVQRLGRAMRLCISESETAALAAIIGVKEFVPGHLNKPGIDKWRDAYTSEQLQIVEESGIWDVFSVFGYAPPRRSESSRGGSGLRSSAYPLSLYYLFMAGSFPVFEIAQSYEIPLPPSRWAGVHFVFGSEQNLVDEYVDRLSTSVLTEIYGQ